MRGTGIATTPQDGPDTKAPVFDILHHIGIDARPDEVFNALTTIEGPRGGWPHTATGSAAKGGSDGHLKIAAHD